MEFRDIPVLSGAGRLGHFAEIRDDRLGLLERVAREGHALTRVAFLPRDICMANDPRAIYQVLVGEADAFRKSPVLRSVLYPLAGEGLFTSEGELWRRQRKLMAPIFRLKSLGRFAECMASCTERAVDGWPDGGIVDIAREMTRITMSVAGKTLFDAETFDDADEIGHALTVALGWANAQTRSVPLLVQARIKTALDIRAGRWPERLDRLRGAIARRLDDPLVLPTKATREMRAALALLDRRVARMIADRRAGSAAGGDLLGLLLEARDEDDGSAMSDKQVRDEVVTLFVAGHETTATGLAWSFYLLARHPEAYARARDEARALGAARASYQDLPRLGYCLRVFKEALRLYPPVYLFGRQALRPIDVAGYRLPAGTIVLVSPYALHRRADLWPDPARFDPERFTAEAEEARPREAYLPFSGGPRTCIGNHFALMEGPLVMASVLRRYDLALAPGTVIEPEPSATLRPRDGIVMRADRRRF